SIIIFLSGLILSLLFIHPLPKNLRREFISMLSFQNCGYLPMNIAFFLFSPPIKKIFLVYTFLYILGFDILMWSIGSFLIFKKGEEKFKISSLFTPPILGIISALLIIILKAQKFIPQFIIDTARMIGETSFVLSMIILGGWLAKNKSINKVDIPILAKISILKLMVIPLLFFLLITIYKPNPLLGLFILLQASMPSAASLPIVVNLRKANSEFTSQGVFLTHLISIFSVPFWLNLYIMIFPLEL
ncbi:MAG: AEC family transporter, partial [Candidatus Omnitrophica bacterium]|nr:AEC family transporter [Candidatus Omnitrophota bacterium]